MDYNGQPSLYEIPSCKNVYHVQQRNEMILIQMLYGDMVISYRGDPEKSGFILRDILANRISIAYILIHSFCFDIYFTTEEDYAAAQEDYALALLITK